MLYYHIQLYYTISYYILYYKSSFQIISKANHLGPSRGHAWSNATQLDVPDFYRFLLCPKRLGDKTICTLLFCPWGYRFTWSSLPKEKIREGVQFNCTTYEGILDNIGIEVQNVHHQLHARQKENRIRTQKTAATSAPRRSLFQAAAATVCCRRQISASSNWTWTARHWQWQVERLPHCKSIGSS